MRVSCEYWLVLGIIIPTTCTATIDMRKYAFSRNYLVNSVQLRVLRFQGKQKFSMVYLWARVWGGKGVGERKVSPYLLVENQKEAGSCLFYNCLSSLQYSTMPQRFFILFFCTPYFVLFSWILIYELRTPTAMPKQQNRKKFSANWGDQLGKLVILEKKGEGKLPAGLAPIMACPRGYARSLGEPHCNKSCTHLAKI